LNHTITKKGIVNDTVSTLIVQLYQFATLNSFTVRQKLTAINLTLSVLKALIETNNKEEFAIYIEQ